MSKGDLFNMSSAVFSPDRRYRYHLARCWGLSTSRVCFVGLNPSRAGELHDDHTIRKEIGFAQRWGFGALDKVNLYGLVSTDPRGLATAADPFGPDNSRVALGAIAGASRVVVAWGDIPKGLPMSDVLDIVATVLPSKRFCLGLTQSGSPRHPSRLSYETPLEAW